ncbi:MAG: ZIP family metal transporter [Erysipelotrichales bacterium]|nr:ZIP family metal transporter [Erysipelotrichales bacterium]
METIISIIMPWVGTILGSAVIFFVGEKLDMRIEKILYGFASGIMIAASFFSLLEPALNYENVSIIEVAVGFIVGMMFLLVIDTITPHFHVMSNEVEGIKNNLSKTTLMFLAIAIHNIPEGMAVGVGLLGSDMGVSTTSVMALSLGIALQNIPEGTIIALPFYEQNGSKFKSFIIGTISGIVEPLALIITLMFSNFFKLYLPFLLSFAAGAMIYVVIEELIPASQNGSHSNISTIGFMFGFVLMMVLSVILG